MIHIAVNVSTGNMYRGLNREPILKKVFMEFEKKIKKCREIQENQDDSRNIPRKFLILLNSSETEEIKTIRENQEISSSRKSRYFNKFKE